MPLIPSLTSPKHHWIFALSSRQIFDASPSLHKCMIYVCCPALVSDWVVRSRFPFRPSTSADTRYLVQALSFPYTWLLYRFFDLDVSSLVFRLAVIVLLRCLHVRPDRHSVPQVSPPSPPKKVLLFVFALLTAVQFLSTSIFRPHPVRLAYQVRPVFLMHVSLHDMTSFR